MVLVASTGGWLLLVEVEVSQQVQDGDCKACRKQKERIPYCYGRTFRVNHPYGGKENIPWYEPSDILFCRIQMWWLVDYVNVIEHDMWPINPQGSGYIDPIVQAQPRGVAPFETPALIWAEVDKRLKATGQAGEELEHQIHSGVMTVDGLSPFAKSALNYITGFRGKVYKMDFNDWKRQRKYREKVK